MKKSLVLVGTLAAASLLSACQSARLSTPQTNVAVKPAPNPEALKPAENSNAALNGKWIPTDEAAKGVYVAEFRNGVFVSRSPTTNKPLAKGSYSVVSDTSVDLKFVGAATKTAVEAKCDRQTPSTMYCTPSIGSPFNLRRT